MLSGYQHIETGKISLFYHQGFFRKLSLNNLEFLRGIYPAVRDRDWGTVPCVKTEIIPDAAGSKRMISERQFYIQDPIRFVAEIAMDQIAENEWLFSFEGRADNDFLKNRIGWNVLLPLNSITGQEFIATSAEKTTIRGVFPVDISPVQPIKNLKKLTFTDKNGCRIELVFTGDIFEMEDQRNWTDASFKIYSTPLDLPFPAKINQGDIIRQSIRLTIENLNNKHIHIPVAKNKNGVFPTIGLNALSNPRRYHSNEIDLLSKLQLDFLSIHLKNNAEEEIERLLEHFRLCSELELKTVISIHFFKNESLQDGLQKVILQNNNLVKSIELFDANSFLCQGTHIESTLTFLKTKIPGVLIGGGTYAYYAELNRAEKLIENVDYMAFSVSPQVHAFDDHTIIENIEGISHVVRDAKKRFDLPIHINALTLAQRMNFVATDNNSNQADKFIDKRQNTIFTALWILGVLKSCAIEGCSAVSMFETIGKKGVLDSNSEDTLDKNTEIFPVYYLIREVHKYKGCMVVEMKSDNYLCEGIQIVDNHTTINWIWNYGDEPVEWKDLTKYNLELFDFKFGKWETSNFNGNIQPNTWCRYQTSENE